MISRKAGGIAAYHARIDAEKTAALIARVAELEARLVGWTPPFQMKVREGEAAVKGYNIGLADGYSRGACDALEPMSPDHAKALACRS